MVGFVGLIGVSQMESVSVLQRNKTNKIYVCVYIEKVNRERD